MFTHGFVKTAFWNGIDDEDHGARNTALAGAGAAGATYAHARSGKKTNFMKVIEHKTPKSAWQRGMDRVLYGADKIYYSGDNPKGKQEKYEGTVMHNEAGTKSRIKGKDNIGDFTEKQNRALEDKYPEQKLLSKADKNHPKGALLSSFGKGRNRAKNLKKRLGDKFFVKPRHGFASGVGGGAFLNEKDYAGEHSDTKGRVSSTNRRGKKYLAQEKMNIKEDVLTGAPREIRVHAIGGKVVPGAASTRSKNITDIASLRKAEKYFQGVLDKMPKKHKPKNMMWAPDIAVTDKGFRTIEANRGIAASGLLDHRTLRKGQGLVGGMTDSLGALTGNNAIYKHVTGRHTRAAAAGRAALVGAGTIAAARYLRKKKEE